MTETEFHDPLSDSEMTTVLHLLDRLICHAQDARDVDREETLRDAYDSIHNLRADQRRHQRTGRW